MPGPDPDLKALVAELNRGLPSGRTGSPAPDASSGLDPVLAQAAAQGASDLLLVVGAPIATRINGRLTLTGGPALEDEEVHGLLLPLLSSRQQQELQRSKTVDFCFEREGIGRFRANLHFQRGTLAGSLRLLPARIPTLESLHLPPTLRRWVEAKQGLVLVTGATGSGKSSTLAALIDIVNSERRDHIVTIEDPVEYLHVNRSAIIEQIEVGQDTPDFASSLRSVVRQNPDVILVGEMRDPETIATVLTAAETGHLVLSTLHTNDASQAVSRILDSFPQGNQPQIRQQLSLALLAIVAQQLVPTRDGRGRCPAVELLVASHAVRNMIRKGDDHQIYTAISTGRSDGMTTMEQSLAELVRADRITRETAMAHCYRPDELPRYLKGRTGALPD
jgi:twitching motility protein PilT